MPREAWSWLINHDRKFYSWKMHGVDIIKKVFYPWLKLAKSRCAAPLLNISTICFQVLIIHFCRFPTILQQLLDLVGKFPHKHRNNNQWCWQIIERKLLAWFYIGPLLYLLTELFLNCQNIRGHKAYMWKIIKWTDFD